ncbi:MAG: hypothetical protein ABEH90_09365 [Halolamina sp.]
MHDIREHPDAPDLDRITEFTVEPVPLERVRERRENGEVLVRDNLLDRDDLDVRIPLSDEPAEDETENVGVALYRLVQLFGTPNLPEYLAGSDISWREDDTFGYLFRAVTDQDEGSEELPDSWLFTVHDYHVRLGASVVEWRDEAGDLTADTETALTSLHLAHNLANEPVQCEFKDLWF